MRNVLTMKALVLLIGALVAGACGGCGAMSCRMRPPASVGERVDIGDVPGTHTLAVAVTDARTERGRLVVDLELDGACAVSDIGLFSQAGFDGSDPPACDVVVAAEGEPGCSGATRDGVTFDLTPLVERLLTERPDSRALMLRVGPAAGGGTITVSTYRL